MNLPAPFFMSVRGREAELGATLAAFHREWPTGPLGATVVVDARETGPIGQTVAQIGDTFHRMLLAALAVAPASRGYLFLEDDVRVAPQFASRLGDFLGAVPAWLEARPFALALYRCPPHVRIGNQGVVLSRPLADYVARRWLGDGAIQEPQADRRLRLIVEEAGLAFPTLPIVQHVGRRSTYGGGFHRDEEWQWPVD